MTQRKRGELNLEFLASVSHALLHVTGVDDMMQTVGAKLGAFLDLSLCAFVDINETADEVEIFHDWHRADVPGLVGVYPLPDFVEPEFVRAAREGDIIVVRDTVTDPRTEPTKFTALSIAAFICVPLIRDGQWQFALCLNHSTAYDWREDEIALAREVTARIWTRLERLRAEAALQESEDRYRTLFNSMDEGFCVIDMIFDKQEQPVDYRFLEVNPTFERQMGLHDATGQLVSVLVPTLERYWYEIYGKVSRTGEAVRFINEVKGLDRWLDIYACRVGGPNSRKVAVVFNDITARMRVEKALQDSEERYRTLFDSMDEAFCIIEMMFDEHGAPIDYRFLIVNPAFAKQTGMHDAVGKRMRELVPTLEAHWFDIYGAVAQTGEPIRFVNQAQDMDNRWFDVYACRVGGPDSQKVAIIFSDISERRRSVEALRESEERYRYLFSSIDEGFCVIEMIFDKQEQPVDYRFLEVNPSFEKQSGLHDVVGKRFREFAPEIESSWFIQYGDVALTGEPVRFINESRSLDGWFDVYAFRIGGPESRKVAIIFNNITERTKAEHALRDSAEALVDLDRRKDEFLAMLGHELRNPLAPLSNAAHILRLQSNEDPLQRQARQIIERQVSQLKHLVDDLLEISRVTTGRLQLRQFRTDVSGIVERAVETAQPLITQRGHELTVSLPLQPIWLHADAARMEQVVVNLLTNAAKYTDEGGQIWLTVQQDGDEMVLRVRDTGVGIAAEFLPRIFDLFTQADRSLDRSEGGLGIGLCLVKRLVDLHGGTVQAHSVLGQGSEFVVRIPVMRTTVSTLSVDVSALTLPQAKHCRVLIVDDNVDAAQSLALLLNVCGHDVRLAHDGPAAVEAARDYRPDLAIMDIGLPGFDGYEAAKRMRQHPVLQHAMLVAMTGYGQENDRLRSLAAGFDHHLVKPVNFDSVQEILALVSAREREG